MDIVFKTVFLCLSISSFAKEFYIIRMHPFSKNGMFAAANQVLGQLYLYDHKKIASQAGLEIDFDVFGLYYDPMCGSNWWTYYFEPICIGEKEGAELRILSKEEQWAAFVKRRHIPRKEAAVLVQKYIHVKPHILQQVEQFMHNYFQNFFIIGVHYRGTDKEKEAPRVSCQAVFQEIEESIPKDRPYRIFVATDEELFLEKIERKFPGHILAADVHRSKDAQGVHFAHAHQYHIGEEAVIDCLLLSNCNLLIRTSSNLSLWSTYFNPEIPVILLNHRYANTLEPE